MNISYKSDVIPSADKIIDLYKSSGMPRPVNDKARITMMYENSNLVISAWDGELLVGVSRCLTDFCWSCYLADLSVRHEYKHEGIGKKLIEMTKEKIGEQTMLLLLSVPTAMEYYPKVGFKKVDNGFLIDRTE
jgi:N-acetylglutamate synthase-like GNAT family acetyltransferase